jgi:hypothetical protein
LIGWGLHALKQYPFYAGVPKTTAPLPPEPRLRTIENGQFAAFFHQQRRELSSYGWVDKDKKIVRVPIERAMELYAEH